MMLSPNLPPRPLFGEFRLARNGFSSFEPRERRGPSSRGSIVTEPRRPPRPDIACPERGLSAYWVARPGGVVSRVSVSGMV